MGSDPILPPGQHLVPELRVKHYGRIPMSDPARWSMIFGSFRPGASTPVKVPELAAMEQREVTASLHCASGWTTPGLVWSGVPATVFLDRFPPPPGTVGVIAYAEYGYSTNLRLIDLREPTSLVATHLNGEPLTPEHGFPVRLVVPHLYGYKNPKWFRGWEYLTEPRRGFWEERGYHLIGDPTAEQRYSYLE